MNKMMKTVCVLVALLAAGLCVAGEATKATNLESGASTAALSQGASADELSRAALATARKALQGSQGVEPASRERVGALVGEIKALLNPSAGTDASAATVEPPSAPAAAKVLQPTAEAKPQTVSTQERVSAETLMQMLAAAERDAEELRRRLAKLQALVAAGNRTARDAEQKPAP